MDYKFPHTLFPVYSNSGPPTSKFQHNVGGWGSYGQVLEVNTARHEEGDSLPKVGWKFKSQHQVKGEPWLPLEPVPMPLLKPKRAVTWSSTALPDPMDFSEHMQNFYQYNYKDAFCTMSHVLGENLYFGQGKRKASDRKGGCVWQTDNFIESLKSMKCSYNSMGYRVKRYTNLLSDVIHDIPPDLLADLLHEELAHRREQEQFFDNTTGGAIEYIPFTSSSALQEGCLVYPGRMAFDNLYFHRVALEFQEGKPPCFVLSPTPLSFKLSGPVRQLTVGVRRVHCEVGVRSDYLCGVWKVSEKNKPQILEVVKTKHRATCLSASPHVQGELLVASENGAAHLWTLGRGLQRFRQEACNLYFNTKSPWRWCDFSGHPRVMVYADRSGVELTDIRVKDNSSHTLFRIGQTPDCKSGERVILSKYLREVHTFHHLITTQHSAYILDERFPCLPMAKQDHMMDQPPMFAQAVAGSLSGGGATKVLLGSQRSQEVTVLQYSGGREEACVTRGPPLALLSPRDCLGNLSVQLPHRQHLAQDRLAVPAAGLTFIHHSQGKDECICVLQLTEAGDIFYHTLKPQAESESPATNQNSVNQDSGVASPSRSPRPGNQLHATLQSSRSGDPGDMCSSEPSSPDENSGIEGRSWDIPNSGGLEMVVNDPDYDPDPSYNVGPGNSPETVAPFPPSTSQSVKANGDPVSPRSKVSAESLLMWKKWLLKLFSKTNRNNRCHLPHLTVKTQGLLPRETPKSDPLEEDRLRSLRKDLRETMRREDVLVNSNTYLKPLALVPIPGPVETSEWADALSERMTVSWEPGLSGWRSWWLERLGLNREEKVEALRRKRRREKQARAHRRRDLSGSFTSSISYQSHLDSDALSGWSSATSQDDGGGSFHCQDWDDLSDPGTPRPATPNQHAGGSRPTTPLGQFGSSWSGPTTPNTEPSSSFHLSPLQEVSTSLHRPTVAAQQSGRISPPASSSLQYNESQSSFASRKQPSSSQPTSALSKAIIVHKQPSASSGRASSHTLPSSFPSATHHSQSSSTGTLFTPTKNPASVSLSPWTTVNINVTTPAASMAAAQKKPRARDQDYLRVLFGSQEAGSATLEEGCSEGSLATPLASSQVSSISSSQRTPRVGVLSQNSQPKRKKSRMGF